MRKPLKKYCNLCGAPVIPEIRNYGQGNFWYQPQRCPKCFKKRTHYKRHFLPGFHGKSKPEGSRYISKTPYPYVMIKHNGQWKREHRVIMEQLLDRPLLRSEIVHHINENTLDNKPQNLQLCFSIAEHRKYHSKKHCLVKGCTKPHRALGYCKMHYDKFRNHGNPLYKRINAR